jgi:uncharacterized repeat protein (TIGR03803 family)
MPRQKYLPIFVAAFGVILGSFALTTPVFAASKERVLYSFKDNGTDGHGPNAPLIFDVSGNLYGTTANGGTGSRCGTLGCGTVFELSPGSNGSWTEKVLHSFDWNGKDGYYPLGGLISDTRGNLYGTTGKGGTGQCFDQYNEDIGCGTTFELMPSANGKWTEKVLHSFGHGKDGIRPNGGLTFDASGNLYGTTAWGGGNGQGTVFELISANGRWTEKVLHSFNGADGNYPSAGLPILDAKGNLYGTAEAGGTYSSSCGLGCGTVFELSPSKDGKWTVRVLHKFNNTDGMYPDANLIFDASGNLYSVTTMGGTFDEGTVFELLPDNGNWMEKVLHSFAYGGGDGAGQPNGIILDASDILYGTTSGGGAYYSGSIFKLSPDTSGKWTEKVLHSFDRRGVDGRFPDGAILDASGNLYGTTTFGGAPASGCYGSGCGTVFEITP